jgi:glycosyltransferase involved in cell wall biosynthesis
MRFMILSDSPRLNTGYGQNSYNLLNEMSDMGHEVAAIGLGEAGDVARYKGIDLYPAATPFMLAKTIQKFSPEVVMHIRDNWIFIPKYVAQPYSLIQMMHAHKVKLMNYTPVQATPLPPEFVQTIHDQADFTYITNQIGVDSLVAQGAPKEKLGTLYNGINPGIFRTFKTTRKGTGLPEDKKLAIFVGANMDYRKEIPLTMMAFKKYNEVHQDAALYLHTNPFGGFDLPLFIRNMGLDKSCLLKSAEGMKLMTWDLSVEEMATMYNFGDAYITCSAAEGFNQPALEALACGLPVVMTDTPIHREIFGCFGDRALFVKASQTLPTVWAFEHMADPTDGALKLEKAFEMGKRPINMKEYPQFSWKKLAQQVIDKALEIKELPFPDPLKEREEMAKRAWEESKKLIEQRDKPMGQSSGPQAPTETA